MDFNDNPTEAAFRTGARVWLNENAPLLPGAPASRTDEPALLLEAKAWQAKKAEAGYACITWPMEWGGAGGTPVEQLIFDQEEARHNRAYGFFTIGLGMCVPTVLAFADDETRHRLVGPAIRGEKVWCQLFSEPSAGSDVAASRMRAVRTDDESGDWMLDGQKVWTSGAHYADYGIVLVRTDADLPKHKGLTMFWIDMRSPGIDVRPIHQASGEKDFNEVYLTGVRVPDGQRLGDVGKGWDVTLFTLMNERLAVGGGAGANWPELLALARRVPGIDGTGSAAQDGGFRERLADWYVAAEGLKLTRYRAMTALSRGQAPGPESSIGKIVSARQMQELGQEALDRLDQYGILRDDESGLTAAFQYSWFWGAGMRIAGGTDEILKNVIAERVLRLPSGSRVDRNVPFKDIPCGA